MSFRCGVATALALVLVMWLGQRSDPGAGVAIAAEGDPVCRVVEYEFTPTEDLQIVVWIEDVAGNYVDTLYITNKTGRFGLGNRPGMMEFNSGPLWPYGRRTTTFPVWAGRHGQTFPLLEFQDENDDNLSHAIGESSREHYYCRPIRPDEELWDATSCASTVYTDKGKFSDDQSSRYPPRSDITFNPDKDDDSVDGMGALNPFDAVSRATPPGGQEFQGVWAVPFDMQNGDYVLWVEVSKEFDQNEFYDYPAPTDIPWAEYGVPYRGQPSLVYQVPFTLTDAGVETSRVLDYTGYGDPDGNDGEIRPPDDTITVDMPGSGAGRLTIMIEQEAMYRVGVNAYPSPDDEAPGGPGAVQVDVVTPSSADVRFMASGDDGMTGQATGYEFRYLVGEEMTAESFERASPALVQFEPVAGGDQQRVTFLDLIPQTHYVMGVRAFDECRNTSSVTVFELITPRPEAGEVDACFVATAAYGSVMAGDVARLRSFRDLALRSHVAGELAVEGYYTFGPALAGAIAPSETLRRAARAALAPIVSEIRSLTR